MAEAKEDQRDVGEERREVRDIAREIVREAVLNRLLARQSLYADDKLAVIIRRHLAERDVKVIEELTTVIGMLLDPEPLTRYDALPYAEKALSLLQLKDGDNA